MDECTILTPSSGLSPRGSYFVPTTSLATILWAPFAHPRVQALAIKGILNRRKGTPEMYEHHPRRSLILRHLCFWPMMEMNSGGTNIFNGRACHRVSCQELSNQIQGPPRSTVEGKAKIGMWGLAKTHPELFFHSVPTTCPQEDLHGILPHFYPPRFLILYIGMGHWSPPKFMDLMVCNCPSCGSWWNFVGGLWSSPKGTPCPNFFPLHPRKGRSPKFFSIKETNFTFKAQHGEVANL